MSLDRLRRMLSKKKGGGESTVEDVQAPDASGALDALDAAQAKLAEQERLHDAAAAEAAADAEQEAEASEFDRLSMLLSKDRRWNARDAYSLRKRDNGSCTC